MEEKNEDLDSSNPLVSSRAASILRKLKNRRKRSKTTIIKSNNSPDSFHSNKEINDSSVNDGSNVQPQSKNIANNINKRQLNENEQSVKQKNNSNILLDVFKDSIAPKESDLDETSTEKISKMFSTAEYEEFDKLPSDKRQKLYFIAKLKPIISPNSTIVDYLASIDLNKINQLMSFGSLFTQIILNENSNYISSSNSESNNEQHEIKKLKFNSIEGNNTVQQDSGEYTPVAQKNEEGRTDTIFFRLSNNALQSPSSGSLKKLNDFDKSITSYRNSIKDEMLNIQPIIQTIPGPLNYLSKVRENVLNLQQIYEMCIEENLIEIDNINEALKLFKNYISFCCLLSEHYKHLSTTFAEYYSIHRNTEQQLLELLRVDRYIGRNLTLNTLSLIGESINTNIATRLRELYATKLINYLATPHIYIGLTDKSADIIKKLKSINIISTTKIVPIENDIIMKLYTAAKDCDTAERYSKVNTVFSSIFHNQTKLIIDRCSVLLNEQQDKLITHSELNSSMNDFLSKVAYELRKSFVNKLKASIEWRYKNQSNLYDVYNKTGPNNYSYVGHGQFSLNTSSVIPEIIAKFLNSSKTTNKKIFLGIDLATNKETVQQNHRASLRTSVLNFNSYSELMGHADIYKSKITDLKNVPLTPIELKK